MKKYLLIAFLLLVVPTAQATTFQWSFAAGGASIIFDPATGENFHFGANPALSVSTVVYDEVAQTLVASLVGTGDVVNSNTGAVLATGSDFDFSITYTGVTGDPLTPNLETAIEGIGSYSISNVGNIDGVAGNDSVSGTVETHMNLLDGDTVLAQIPDAGIQHAGWFHGIGDVLVNGAEANALFDSTGGDSIFSFGTATVVNGAEVPEPITAALLGLGVLGGAIKRRKSL